MKKLLNFFIVMLLGIFTSSQSFAQGSSYIEATQYFFNQPADYDISTYMLMQAKLMENYKAGESKLRVTAKGFSYQLKGEKEHEFNFIHKIKNLTVLSLGEEIVMPMYSIGDGYAVRVTQAGKEYTVYRYTQILSGEYVLLDVFNLYKK